MKISEQIVFVYVTDLEAGAGFYETAFEFPLVVDQGSCRIYQVAEKAYLGVCERPKKAGKQGSLLTFVTDEVDEWYERVIAAGAKPVNGPKKSAEYGIYNFFAADPDGNLFEVQRFDDPSWRQPQ